MHKSYKYARSDAASRLLFIGFVLLVLGEAGHVLLDQMNADVAHHLFHILFPLVAFAIFGLFVARDVRTNGWPTFSWRLSASPRGEEGRAPSSR
jgi:hypothetical protein